MDLIFIYASGKCKRLSYFFTSVFERNSFVLFPHCSLNFKYLFILSCIDVYMALPNPFRRKDENTRHAWGYTFQWTPDHLTEEQLHPMKFSYDVLAEECLNRLDKISPPTSGELPRNQSTIPKGKEGKELPKRDLYVLLKDHASEDEKLGELWNEVNTIPDWVVSDSAPLMLVTLLKLDLGLGTNRKRSGSVL